MHKLLIKTGLIIMALIAALVVAALLLINPLARAGIEKAATYALGVNARVGALSISLVEGNFSMEGLTIDNPEGFTDPYVMKSGKFELDLKPASLFSDKVQLEKFELDGLEINIEQKLSGNNISPILSHLKEIGSSEETGNKQPSPKAKKEAGGKKLVIDRVTIKNVVAIVRLPALPGEETAKTIKIPEIVLNNVTRDSEGGITIHDFTRKLFSTIVAAVVENGQGVLPDELMAALKADISDLSSIIEAGGEQLMEQVSGEIEKEIEKLEEKAGKLDTKVKKKLKLPLGR